MGPTNISMVSYFFFSFIMLSSFATSISTNIEPFLECLSDHSNPSQPIFQALYLPTNPSFPQILQLYMRNSLFNGTTPEPQLIITALHVSHIQAAVICAKSHGQEMRIRSGGHDFEGLSYVSTAPFFLLDMFNLRRIDVNIDDETAWIEAGAILGEVYYRIAEKSNTHAFAAGMCPTVGVGGQISGGGIGTLTRKYGLAADNIVDAMLVNVDGHLLDRALMGEDLFWAITGGGAPSFGVVVAYKVSLVAVPPTVTFATKQITYNTPNFTHVIHKYLQVVNKLHEDIYVKLTLQVTKSGEFKTLEAKFFTFFLGESERLVALVNESFPELRLGFADCIQSNWVKTLVQWAGHQIDTPPEILLNRIDASPSRKRKSDFVKKPIPKQGLESIFKKLLTLENPVLKFFPFGGIMDRIPPSAKPFPHRVGNIVIMEIACDWDEPGVEAASYYKNLARTLYEYITPFVSKSREAYLNYRDLDLGINHHGPHSYDEAKAYGLKYYKDNFERLVQIKSRVDPENFFRNEQSVPVLPLISVSDYHQIICYA